MLSKLRKVWPGQQSACCRKMLTTGSFWTHFHCSDASVVSFSTFMWMCSFCRAIDQHTSLKISTNTVCSLKSVMSCTGGFVAAVNTPASSLLSSVSYVCFLCLFSFTTHCIFCSYFWFYSHFCFFKSLLFLRSVDSAGWVLGDGGGGGGRGTAVTCRDWVS